MTPYINWKNKQTPVSTELQLIFSHRWKLMNFKHESKNAAMHVFDCIYLHHKSTVYRLILKRPTLRDIISNHIFLKKKKKIATTKIKSTTTTTNDYISGIKYSLLPLHFQLANLFTIHLSCLQIICN